MEAARNSESLPFRSNAVHDLCWVRWMAVEALRIADVADGDDITPTLVALTLSAHIAYEEGDTDRAGQLLQELMAHPATLIPIESLARAYPLLARVYVSRGDYTRAVTLLSEGERLGDVRGSVRLVSACLRERIYCLLSGGTLTDAQESLRTLSCLGRLQPAESYDRRSPLWADHALAGAWIPITFHGTAEGLEVMRHLHRDAHLRGDNYATVRLGVCLVDSLHILGHELEARTTLLKLFRSGMRAGLCQTFLDGGPGVRTLILGMHANGCGGDEKIRQIIDHMVMRLECYDHLTPLHHHVVLAQETMLTPRESHVLRLIGDGFTNKRIARDLQITPETVKSHAKHIFAKLGTRTRAESIARALQLGIL